MTNNVALARIPALCSRSGQRPQNFRDFFKIYFCCCQTISTCSSRASCSCTTSLFAGYTLVRPVYQGRCLTSRGGEGGLSPHAVPALRPALACVLKTAVKASLWWTGSHWRVCCHLALPTLLPLPPSVSACQDGR